MQFWPPRAERTRVTAERTQRTFDGPPRYGVVFSDASDRSERVPTALADLGDGDNNHLLCFDVEGDPREVRFPAGFLTDPRDDLNPDTTAPVGR